MFHLSTHLPLQLACLIWEGANEVVEVMMPTFPAFSYTASRFLANPPIYPSNPTALRVELRRLPRRSANDGAC